MLNVNKTYVIHYKPLADRKTNLLNQFAKFGIEAHWMEEEEEETNISKYYVGDPRDWYKKTVTVPYEQNITYKHLNRPEISLAIKHIKCYKDIIDNKVETAVIFEDDVVFCEDFDKKFNLFLEQTPSDWDIIFIGSGCNLTTPSHLRRTGKVAYFKDNPATRCADSYVVNYRSISKLWNTLLPITLPMDCELNYQLYFNNLKSYWWEPPLVKQGSQCGLYNSEVQI